MYRGTPERLHVTLFGEKGAEAWVRRVHGIPAHVGCWRPYRVLVRSNGGTLSYTAFHTIKEFKRWLYAAGYRLTLDPHHGYADVGGTPAWVARFGTIDITSH